MGRKSVLVFLALALPLVLFSLPGPDRARPAFGQEGSPGAGTATELSAAFERVADVIGPSVVNISSIKVIRGSKELRRLPEEAFPSPFRDFFGDDFFDRFFRPGTPGQGYVQKGLGTGVIVSPDGYVLTNHHVVRDADEVTVRLSDDREFRAEVVGSDPKSDLAVVKIEAEGLAPAKLGDSDALQVGEWVVAAGNPFGLSHTITAGIVSAKGRSNVGIADYEDFIQTDCAINPGNSGGPLVNLRGEVVGINTAIFTRSGGYMGIGFAIPVNMAKSVMQSLIDHGRVVRGWLGVVIQDLDPDLARSFGFDGTDAVLVGDVTAGGPAEKAGIRRGDLILAYDGRKVTGIHDLRTAVAATKPGRKVDLLVLRDRERRTISVEIGKLGGEAGSAATPAAEPDLGMTLRDLTPEIASRLGYEGESGVLVTKVEPTGAAARLGIAPNDLIQSVQGVVVDSVRAFREALRKRDLRQGVRMSIRSGRTRRFVFFRLG